MRWLRHFFAPSAHAAFPEASLDRIAHAIADGERLHSGQVMFAVESDLPLALLWKNTSARARAEHAFALLRTWDTEANNGVLIYLLLADHAIEIVADRGAFLQTGEIRVEQRLELRVAGRDQLHESAECLREASQELGAQRRRQSFGPELSELATHREQLAR